MPPRNSRCEDNLKIYYDGTSPNPTYCGDGQNQDRTVTGPLANVWSPNFCFRGVSKLTLRFVTETTYHHTYPGFFAKYFVVGNNSTEVNMPRPSTASDNISPSSNRRITAPCGRDQWTCFNRKCIPRDRKCDHIDDCGDYSDESFAHANCRNYTANYWGSGMNACDFENDTSVCRPDILYYPTAWKFKDATYLLRGPSVDHTKRFYVYQRGRGGGISIIPRSLSNGWIHSRELDISAVTSSTNTTCLSFYYFMNGKDVGSLSVYYKADYSGTSRKIWHRIGHLVEEDFGGSWQHGEVQLPASDRQAKVTVVADFASNKEPHMAIDDISSYEGQCHGNDISCNFEVDTCRWTTEPSVYGGQWKRYYGDDKSSSTRAGYYMVLTSSNNIHASAGAALVSPVITGTDALCLVFWYRRFFYPQYNLNVWIRSNGRKDKEVHITNVGPGRPEWSVAKVPLNANNFRDRLPLQIIIRGEIFISNQKIGLDDVTLHNAGCSDIQTDMCSMNQYRCYDGRCIRGSYVCDGIRHCSDNSDEDWRAHCSTRKGCFYFEWQCPSGKCIQVRQRCDGINDCGDWADEPWQDCDPDRFKVWTIIGVCGLMLFVFFSVVAIYAYVRKKQQNRNGRNRLSTISGGAGLPSTPSTPVDVGLPPSYDECLQGGYQYPTALVQQVPDPKDQVPTYESVTRGDYDQFYPMDNLVPPSGVNSSASGAPHLDVISSNTRNAGRGHENAAFVMPEDIRDSQTRSSDWPARIVLSANPWAQSPDSDV